MITAEKLSIMANMQGKLYKIEKISKVHKGVDSGKMFSKVYKYEN